MHRIGVTSPTELSIAKIARSQCGRPYTEQTSRSEFDLLPPLLDCDTKSHSDLIRINENCEKYADAGDKNAAAVATFMAQIGESDAEKRAVANLPCICFLERGDGQAIIAGGNEKSRCVVQLTYAMVPLHD